MNELNGTNDGCWPSAGTFVFLFSEQTSLLLVLCGGGVNIKTHFVVFAGELYFQLFEAETVICIVIYIKW